MRTNSLAALAVCLFAFVWSPCANAQDTAVISSTGEIPKEDYKTWSLFLICSASWLADNRSADLADLYRRFQAFGEAIGDDHLAVWFWKEGIEQGGDATAENVDIRRAGQYCRALKLAPSQSPYLVVTKQYPDLANFPDKTVYKLGILDSTALGALLDRLTDGLVLAGTPDLAGADAGGDGGGIAEVGFWIRFLESAQAALTVPCGVSVEVDAGLFTGALRSCEE
jgi:hypothetical protein